MKAIPDFVQIIEENNKIIADMGKELDRLRTEALQNSLAKQELSKHFRRQVEEKTVLVDFLKVWCDEFEAAFDRLQMCESLEIGEHYIDCATWLLKNISRKSHRIEEVQAWMDNYRPSGLFDNFKGLFKGDN